jgi:hypothetical protein
MGALRLVVDFDDSVSERTLPEDVTVAEFGIYVDEDCLTLNRPRGSRLLSPLASEIVYGPVSGLADWLIENWSAILWETPTPFPKSRVGDDASDRPPVPGVIEALANWDGYTQDSSEMPVFADWQHRHLLGHACSDLAIPSIVIIPEDRYVVLSVDRLPLRLSPSVQFVTPRSPEKSLGLFVVRKADFEAEAKQFIERTIERARCAPEFTHWANWLSERWELAQADEMDARNRLRWMLGEMSAKRVEELRKDQPRIATGLSQVLLDCPVVTSLDDLVPVENMLTDLVGIGLQPVPGGGNPRWQGLNTARVSTNQPDFLQGYQLARLVREKMGLGHDPIQSFPHLLQELDISCDKSVKSSLFRVAVCAAPGKRAHFVQSTTEVRMRYQFSSRFAIASALGRLLWQARVPGQELICGAQGSHARLSQSRRANAFAAEFLLPSSAIDSAITSDELYELMETFGISSSAARWHVSNVQQLRSSE